MTDTPQVKSVARPARYLFLLDPQTCSRRLVGQVARSCNRLWGGAYHGVALVSDGELESEWWQFASALDPDVIHSTIELPADTVNSIHRNLAPAQIRLDSRSDRARAGRSEDGIRHPESATIWGLPRHIAQTGFGTNRLRFFLPIDGDISEHYRLFTRLNFGIDPNTLRSKSVFSDFNTSYQALENLSPSELLENHCRDVSSTFTYANLSKYAAWKPFSVDSGSLSAGFELVVGNSVEDLVWFWNRTLLSKDNRSTTACWMPAQYTEREGFLDTVGTWIRRVYWQGQGPPSGRIVSASLEEAELGDLSSQFRDSRVFLQPYRMESPTPTIPANRPVGLPSSNRGFFGRPPRSTNTENLVVREKSARMRLPTPDFLQHPTHDQECWMVDIDLQHVGGMNRYHNKPDFWRLPKRAALATLFGGGSNSRINRSGRPSLSITGSPSTLSLSIPGNRELFAHLMRPLPTSEEPNPPLKGAFKHFATSDQGRLLQNTVNLFGSISEAGRFLTSPYWRYVIDRLASYSGHGQKSLTYKQLRDEYHRLASQNDDLVPPGGATNYYDDVIQRDLRQLIEAQVLIQGIHARCLHCGMRDWWPVAQLGRQLACGGCSRAFPFPTNPTWRVRLNSLLVRAFRREGIIPLVVTIYSLSEMYSDSAFYIPPQNIYRDYESEVVTDVDLIFFRDGKFIIGEIKSDISSDLNEAELSRLLKVSRALAPDLVLVCGPKNSWSQKKAELVEQAEANFQAHSLNLRTGLIRG